MSDFRFLRDVSIVFEKYSRQISAELFSAKIREPFEHVVANKLRDVKLLTTKLRLLEAKSLPIDNPEASETPKKNGSQQTILDYEEEVSSNIMEQSVVKVITQSNTVKNLLTTQNKKLKPEFVGKKKQIIKELTKYGEHESKLCFMEELLEKSEAKLLEAQVRWDDVVGKLKDIPKVALDELSNRPLVERLESLMEKIELMRWLVTNLVMSRCDQDYDWLSDPHNRLRAFAIARQNFDVFE